MRVTPVTSAQSPLLRIVRQLRTMLLAVVLFPAATFAQAPWERAATNLETTFTGSLARSLALVRDRASGPGCRSPILIGFGASADGSTRRRWTSSIGRG